MATQAKKKKSIRKKLLSMVLLPIFLLTMLITFFGMVLLFQFYSQSIQDELASTTSILMDCLDLTVRGDYSYRDNMLIKGDLNITDSTMLYRVKEKSQIDTTIFWQDTRILTTIEDKYGISAVGTKASQEVVDAVLKNGNTYFSTSADVNGMTYFGYYVPLENSGHDIVGMAFAGKPQKIVFKNIATILLWFVLFSLIAGLIAAMMTRGFSSRMVVDINAINNFLKSISEGSLNVVLEERVEKRNDELGTIGLYASNMRNDLKRMIEMDPLTSLYNRRSCNNKLHELEKEKTPFSIVMCDIDWFKKVNDTYGHDAGDYVLVTVSEIIRNNIKEHGFASRWGGEEFLLIYKLNFDETKKFVEQLQQDIRNYNFVYNGKKINISMTFGIESDNTEKSYEVRIKNADDNLYIGKNNGRDQIIYTKPNAL